jgi:nucleoside-triphosphatase THEP1
MATESELQQRLELFRVALRNLQLDPLVTPQDLARLSVEYQPELVDELEQAIEDCNEKDNKFFFTGHTGCGKSTLLAELGFRLVESQRYFVVNFSIADTIERSAVDHINILFSMTVQMLEAAERRAVKLKPGLQKELYRWLGKHTLTESRGVESEIETSAGASVEGGFPGVIKFLAEIKSKLKINSVVRNEIKTEFDRKISDLVSQINLIKTYIENATEQKVLIIIDDLDKLDLEITESIFSKNIQPLLDPDFRIIYTVPIATLREVSVKQTIQENAQKIHTMRVTKLFERKTVRDLDVRPNAELMALFLRILERRLPQELAGQAVREQIVMKSGGVLRELIRIMDLCCSKCLQVIRGQLRRGQFDQPGVVVDQSILKLVLIDLQISYAEPLGLKDFAALRQIYSQLKPENTEDPRFLALLHGLYVLEYRNAQLWYDLNPIVRDLMILEGELDGPIAS